MGDKPLTFSLIVNTTDRAYPLRALLWSLEHQAYPHFEVIVVVGPTYDTTLEILEDFCSRVRVLRCPKANLSQSRNIGLLAAHGDIVAYIDDDAVPCINWLSQLARLFNDPLIDATGGAAWCVHPNRPALQHRIGLVSSLAHHENVRVSWLDYIVPRKENSGRQWQARMMGVNMAFRRQSLLTIGGFDEYYTYIAEETDLALRMSNAGFITHPVLEAPVYHVPASSRNRTPDTYEGKIWMESRSFIYFVLKNAPGAGESYSDILKFILHRTHGCFMRAGQLWHDGKITFRRSQRIRFGELIAAIDGLGQGLFAKRKIIPIQVTTASLDAPTSPIKPYHTRDSAMQTSVDPVSGLRSSIVMTEPPLRIALLSATYPPKAYDGISRLTHLMAQGLFELGHTVHVVTRGNRERVTFYDGAYVHEVAPHQDRYLHYRQFADVFHTLNHSHVVHDLVQRLRLNDGVQIVDSPIWQSEGLVTAIQHEIPVVLRLVTTQRQLSNLQKNQTDNMHLMGDLERKFIELAAHVLPNTVGTLETIQYTHNLRLSSDRYTVVPYGVVPVPEGETRPIDINPNQSKTDWTILFVGRLEQRKGITDLFAAIPKILQKVPNVHFIIAGSDNSQHDGFRKKNNVDYPTYFSHHYGKYASNVTFQGLVSDEALQKMYQSCDLFVAPSLYESFGLVYLEAMNYAKPVVGCRTGGIPEVVEDRITGVLVEPGNPDQLAQAVIQLLQTPTKMRELGLAGRQRLIEKFTYLDMARQFAQTYRQTIQKWVTSN